MRPQCIQPWDLRRLALYAHVRFGRSPKSKSAVSPSPFGNPDVLIMDEPTNDLDYETILWLEQF